MSAQVQKTLGLPRCLRVNRCMLSHYRYRYIPPRDKLICFPSLDTATPQRHRAPFYLLILTQPLGYENSRRLGIMRRLVSLLIDLENLDLEFNCTNKCAALLYHNSGHFQAYHPASSIQGSGIDRAHIPPAVFIAHTPRRNVLTQEANAAVFTVRFPNL